VRRFTSSSIELVANIVGDRPRLVAIDAEYHKDGGILSLDRGDS
jgi:hypothetical protein